MLKVGDVVITRKSVGGWSRPFVPESAVGTVTQVRPLRARFFVDGGLVELELYDDEWR
jgi:hypothetical protein